MLDIQHRPNGTSGSFAALLAGQTIGRIDYVATGSPLTYDLTHTEVDSAHEGKGYGRQLVHAVAEWAEREGFSLVASCPYAAKVLERRSRPPRQE
jgi:predicted GNAT family acetyltransferase